MNNKQLGHSLLDEICFWLNFKWAVLHTPDIIHSACYETTYLGSNRATFLACVLAWATLVAWLRGWCRHFLAWAAFSTTWRKFCSGKLTVFANLEHVRVRKFGDHDIGVLDRSWCGLALYAIFLKQFICLVFVYLSAFLALIWCLHTKVSHDAN